MAIAIHELVTATTAVCPKAHTGEIRTAGVRVRRDGMYERPRYRCYPDASDEKVHRFTGIRHRRTADHPAKSRGAVAAA